MFGHVWLLMYILCEAASSDTSSKMDHVLYIGAKSELPCFLPGKSQEATKFLWRHPSGEKTPGNRYTSGPAGLLNIEATSAEDSGLFICEATTADGKVVTVDHNVRVVQLPSGAIHVYFSYQLGSCTRADEDTAMLQYTALLKPQICSVGYDVQGTKVPCEVGTIHANCHIEGLTNPSLTVTIPVKLRKIPNENCDAVCTVLKLSSMEAQVKQEVMMNVVLTASQLTLAGQTNLKPTTFETTTDPICDPGFEFVKNDRFCIPCSPGHFLLKMSCTQCYRNHYVAKYAATECRKCSKGSTDATGAKSEKDCKDSKSAGILAALLTLIGMLVVFVLAFWIIRKLAGDSSLGRKMDKVLSTLLCHYKLCKLLNRKSSKGAAEERTPMLS